MPEITELIWRWWCPKLLNLYDIGDARNYRTYMTSAMPEITELIWHRWCPKLLNLYGIGDARNYWTYMTPVMPEITELIWRRWCLKLLNLHNVGNARNYLNYMTSVMPEITELIWRWWCPKFLNLYEVGDAQMSTEQCWNVLTGENRISERALCQCHFAHTDFPGIGPVSPRRVKGHWWPSIARFSKQTAIISKFSIKGLAFVNWALTAPSD